MGRYYTQAEMNAIEGVLKENCKGDLALFERQINVFREKDDPVLWAETHLYDPDAGEEKLTVKEMFYPFLRCSKKNRALRVGRQVGKCVSSNTRITLPDGSSPTARELYEMYGEDGIFDILSTDMSSFLHLKDVAIIKDNGIKDVTRVVTVTGRRTTNTSNHPYLVRKSPSEAGEWIEGSDIVPGNEVAMSAGSGNAVITWEMVTLVENLPAEPTYSISSLETHNLITDGFITHNTTHTCIDILHTAMHNKGAVILVLVTEKKLMNRMLEIISNFLRSSDIKDSFWKNTSSNKKLRNNGATEEDASDTEPKYDHEIIVGNYFSRIRFFFTGNNPDKVRGQRGTHIYIDEMEYHPDKLQAVVLGILKGRLDIKLSCLSTPAGIIGSWFYNMCMTCADPEDPYGEEFHLTPEMDPNWAELEPILKSAIHNDVIWDLEVKAEFRNAVGSVYKSTLVDAAVERSRRGDVYLGCELIRATMEYSQARKILGVDWNTPQNGVRLVEVMDANKAPWVTRNEIISYSNYTQLAAVKRIMELYDENRYTKIMVDEGHGATQIELLDKELTSRGLDPKKILVVVNSVHKEEITIEYTNSITGRLSKREIKIPVVQSLVDIVAKYLENGLLIPKDEDRPNRLVAEIKNLRRKEGKRTFVFEGGGHSLSALQLALYGFDDMIKKDSVPDEELLVVGNPAGFDSPSLQKAAKMHRDTLISAGVMYSSPFGISSRTPGRRTASLYGRQGRSIISARNPNAD